MRKIAMLLVLSVLYSCGIEYDGETRLVVEADVVDTDGNPLANKAVSVIVSDGEYSDEISIGKTDPNGKAVLIFPSPKNDSTKVHVKLLADALHQEKEYLNISLSDFENYQLSLPQAMLFRQDQITTLNIELEQINVSNHLNSYEIDGTTPEYQVNYATPQDQTYNNAHLFHYLKNQTVTLLYSVRNVDTMIITEHSVEIVIAELPVTYTIIY